MVETYDKNWYKDEEKIIKVRTKYKVIHYQYYHIRNKSI